MQYLGDNQSFEILSVLNFKKMIHNRDQHHYYYLFYIFLTCLKNAFLWQFEFKCIFCIYNM